jgi:hypothetical protein
MKRRLGLLATTKVSLLLAHLLVVERAHAEIQATIRYDSEEQLELARRLSSELASEGYVVELTTSAEPSPCETGEGDGLRGARPSSVWIRLQAAESSNDTVVASICYLGALPFLQQVTASGPRCACCGAESSARSSADRDASALTQQREPRPGSIAEPAGFPGRARRRSTRNARGHHARRSDVGRVGPRARLRARE